MVPVSEWKSARMSRRVSCSAALRSEVVLNTALIFSGNGSMPVIMARVGDFPSLEKAWQGLLIWLGKMEWKKVSQKGVLLFVIGRWFARPIMNHRYLLQRHQSAADHLVQGRQEGIYFFFAVDDFD